MGPGRTGFSRSSDVFWGFGSVFYGNPSILVKAIRRTVRNAKERLQRNDIKSVVSGLNTFKTLRK